MNKRLLAFMVGGGLALGMSGGIPAAMATATDGGLSNFTSCTELQRYLVNTAQQKAWLEVQGGMVLSPMVGGDGWVAPPSPNTELDAILPSAPPPDASGGSTKDFSETNVQEAGVDEPDLIKTDGDYFYLVNGGYLLVADGWPAAEMHELSRLQMEGDPLGLFVAGDTALVISQVWQQIPMADAMSIMPMPYSTQAKVTLVDLTDRAQPKALREVYLEGSYSAARMVDGRVHLVVSTALPIYNFAQAATPIAYAKAASGGWGSDMRELVREYGRSLRTTDMADLAPKMEDHRLTAEGDQVETSPISACEDFYYPEEPNGSSTVSVVTFDMADPQADLQSVTVVGDNGELYAAADSLYIAAVNSGAWYWLAASEEQKETTLLHKFSLGATPQYVASGSVAGWIVNRYAMSEHKGAFRIATTTDAWGWGDSGPQNQLYVLNQNGNQLEVVGTLEGLGHKGERIYAVRYDGDRGYLVTFRQTDPLYTLDLADPAAPKVAGELEIPGFSTYLHPIDDGYLLSIGQNTEKGGADLSLFDVRDPTAPALLDREWLGEGSWSEAMYEPHAFTYFAPLNQLALPLQQWYYPVPAEDGTVTPDPVVFNGTVVFDVDLQQGLTKRGTVDHSGFSDPWSWASNVQRNLYIGEGDTYALYSLSQAALKASDAETLKDLASIELPGKDGWWGPILYTAEPVAAP